MAELTAALREAYAVAGTDVVLFDTLEFRHSAFIDEQGAPAPIRVVRNFEPLIAGLELNAPVNPGELVTFQGLPFEIQLPERTASAQLPEIEITLDNVSGELVRQFDRAQLAETQEKIEVTHRPYLSTDLSGPHTLPPLTMELRGLSVTVTRGSARAGRADLTNRLFPRVLYTAQAFPGLV